MRAVIISAVLMLILIVIIAADAYYVNSVSTEMLDLTFALPSEFGYINNLDEKDIEKQKTEINKLASKWEQNALRINLVSRYTDYERIDSAIYSLKEYFFAGYYADYITARRKLIAALEKQKQNELPIFENIF